MDGTYKVSFFSIFNILYLPLFKLSVQHLLLLYTAFFLRFMENCSLWRAVKSMRARAAAKLEKSSSGAMGKKGAGGRTKREKKKRLAEVRA